MLQLDIAASARSDGSQFLFPKYDCHVIQKPTQFRRTIILAANAITDTAVLSAGFLCYLSVALCVTNSECICSLECKLLAHIYL